MTKHTKFLEKAKLLILLSVILHLSACSSVPPKPPMPRGAWVQMNTEVLAEMEACKE